MCRTAQIIMDILNMNLKSQQTYHLLTIREEAISLRKSPDISQMKINFSFKTG